MILLCLIILPLVAFGSNDTACTRKCQIYDPDNKDCWVQSLTYFSEQVVNSLNDYATINVHVAKWKEANSREDDLEGIAMNDTIARNNGPIKEKDLRELFLLLINKTQAVVDENLPKQFPGELPWVSCPVPQDYDLHMWQIITGASWGVTALAVLIVAFHICYSNRRKEDFKYRRSVD